MIEKNPIKDKSSPVLTEPVYHITHRQDWQAQLSQANYSHPSLETEGFIHCSTYSQIIDTANRYYQSSDDIIVLKLDSTKIKTLIRYENTTGTKMLFPHVYGKIPKTALMQIFELKTNQNGLFTALIISA